MYLKYRDKKLKRLRVSIKPNARFKEIYALLHDIHFPLPEAKTGGLVFAVLELLNNSLRAHRETNAKEPIHIHFGARNSAIDVEVRDRGGGFDPARLPYNIESDISDLDLTGDRFQDYRQAHNNTRFGMGLYIAKKTSSRFRLGFLDETGDLVKWGRPGIVGTVVHLSLERGQDK